MSGSDTIYRWVIDEQKLWPPAKRPAAPYGPTALEVMRSCPLRSCFEASPGYERRTGYAARIGTAFHRTLQTLSEKPVASSASAEVTEEARRRFIVEMDHQDQQKALRPRERQLPRDEARIARATEAIMVEALRLPHAERSSVTADNLASASHERSPSIEVEVAVKSKDGLFYGRIDCATHAADGTHLVDYKSAMRDDLPERYERQLQLYALMWHDTRNEWPIAAEVVYPFMNSTHRVRVDPEICERVGDESRTLVGRVRHIKAPEQLATPGDVCKACEFRPWCQPFWKWQASEQNHRKALERAAQGFDGEIVDLVRLNGFWKVHVRWRGSTIRIIAPIERFEQLNQAIPGMRIHAVDMRLQGQLYQPQAIVTEYSELFLLA